MSSLATYTARTMAIVATGAAFALASMLYAASPVLAADDADPFATPEHIEDFSAELEFFKVESEIVTSVSRHPESLWGAAAAIYVVTSEDIRLSGAQTLRDALRMVPGLDVAAVDYNTSAISARGLNNTFADKMLVLLDGRPIYTPLFGGTIWHQWNTFLPDVDRIEVIRGPGGSLWGANAMNGVINIITKSSEDTQGSIIRGDAGSNYTFIGEGRYGGHTDDDLSYRVWMRGATSKGYGGDGGDDVEDKLSEARGGYRFDWDFGKGLLLFSSGEFLSSRNGSINRAIDPGSGGLVEGDFGDKYDTTLLTTVWRLEKDFANGSSAHLQLAGDYAQQNVPYLSLSVIPPVPPAFRDPFDTIRRTFDAEAQHSFRPFARHRITWGANYRYTNADVNDSVVLGLPLHKDVLNVVGAFLQDEISLWTGARLTLGSKVEYNTFTDTNWQPSARFVQLFGDTTTVWTSVSRAVNTPAYGDMYVTFNLPPDTTSMPGLTVLPVFTADRRNDPTGTVKHIDDTTMMAYEAGVRHRFAEHLTLDVSGFYNDYDGNMTFSGKTQRLVPVDPTTVQALTFLDNKSDGKSYGVEAVLDAKINDWVSTEINGTWQNVDFDFHNTGSVPDWKANWRAVFTPFEQLTIVPTVRYVDKFRIASVFGPTGPPSTIDHYVAFDLAVHYKPWEHWPTISFIGQNLDDRLHYEFSEAIVRPESPVTRTWFIRVEQEF